PRWKRAPRWDGAWWRIWKPSSAARRRPTRSPDGADRARGSSPTHLLRINRTGGTGPDGLQGLLQDSRRRREGDDGRNQEGLSAPGPALPSGHEQGGRRGGEVQGSGRGL